MRQKRTSLYLPGRRGLVLFTGLIAALVAAGCQPACEMEIHGAQSLGPAAPVKLQTTRMGPPGSPGRYDSPPCIRFEEADGVIWELWLSGNDPEGWRLYRADQSGKAERVPLQLLHSDFMGPGHHPEHWPQLQFPRY